MDELLSIVIITKNNQATLNYVLSSTLKLSEIFDVELIIVDGKSTDRTPKIIADFINVYKSYYVNFRILQDLGCSSSFARFMGYKHSKGSVIIFVDGDTPLTNSFVHYLKKEIKDCDIISPLVEVISLDKVTKYFNKFMISLSYLQMTERVMNIPSILAPARIFKRKVLERIHGYPVSSKFFGEDRIVTALAIKLGFKYKFSKNLKLLKIDEPGYVAYWKKHFRYGLGINKDTTLLGKRLLRDYIIARRLSYLNIFLPIISVIYAQKCYMFGGNFKASVQVFLFKYFVDLAMFLGDVVSFRLF